MIPSEQRAETSHLTSSGPFRWIRKTDLVWLHILVLHALFPISDQEGTHREAKEGICVCTSMLLNERDSYRWSYFSYNEVILELTSCIPTQLPVADGLRV